LLLKIMSANKHSPLKRMANPAMSGMDIVISAALLEPDKPFSAYCNSSKNPPVASNVNVTIR